VYRVGHEMFMALTPLWRAVGLARLEKPVAVLEAAVKGAFFDCQMCGQCALVDAGMSCPMNCPKSLRNGPCGGVRSNGNCEVDANMACVWVEAWAGSQRMHLGDIKAVQSPVDHRKTGRSSWLALLPEKTEP
jgi:hypothetical protein